jgi:3-oxoacyl-[acyl-carrier protein] reductase
MELRLKGKKAIVTGGSRGIGKQILDTLVDEGVSVATCARGADALNAAVDEWRGRGVTAYGEALDVTDEHAYEQWFGRSVEALGGVDIFISNVSTRLSSKGSQRWVDAFEYDFLQHVRGAELAIAPLRDSDSASIVFISSIASVMANIIPAEREYGGMKAALNAYSGQLSQRCGEWGIRSNVVTPGPIHFEGGFWDGVKQADPEMFKRAGSLSVLQRLGTPQEVASAVVYLASPMASYITGANLRIDGGCLKNINY